MFRKDGTIASPHCLQSLKLFAEFTGTSTPGLLDPNGKATVQTVRNHFRCFASGWNLKNPDSIIPRHLYDSITNDIKTRIKLKIGLSELNRTKTFLTLENFMYLERQLWENDSHDYVHASHAWCDTGSRSHFVRPLLLPSLSNIPCIQQPSIPQAGHQPRARLLRDLEVEILILAYSRHRDVACAGRLRSVVGF